MASAACSFSTLGPICAWIQVNLGWRPRVGLHVKDPDHLVPPRNKASSEVWSNLKQGWWHPPRTSPYVCPGCVAMPCCQLCVYGTFKSRRDAAFASQTRSQANGPRLIRKAQEPKTSKEKGRDWTVGENGGADMTQVVGGPDFGPSDRLGVEALERKNGLCRLCAAVKTGQASPASAVAASGFLEVKSGTRAHSMSKRGMRLVNLRLVLLFPFFRFFSPFGSLNF